MIKFATIINNNTNSKWFHFAIDIFPGVCYVTNSNITHYESKKLCISNYLYFNIDTNKLEGRNVKLFTVHKVFKS